MAVNTLLPNQIDDIAATTLPKYFKVQWTDIAQEYPDYVSPNIIRKARKHPGGGKYFEFKLQVDGIDNFENTGLYDEDTTQTYDIMQSGTVPWTFQKQSYAYDIREPVFNSGDEQIIDELLAREHSAVTKMWEGHERNLWGAPTSPSDNVPMGIPFWLQKNATTGFNGGNPSGFTSGAAGVDSDTYADWANYTATYSSVSKTDLVRSVKKALRYCNFRPVHRFPELGFGSVQYHAYTTEYVVALMEELAEDRNDNHGADLAKYMNEVVIAGVPFTLSFELDTNDSTNPIYGVNWKYFQAFVQSKFNMKRSKPIMANNQHNVRKIFYDHIMQYVCTNRRAHWVMYQA